MRYGGERTNLPGADLNAACSGPEGARPRDGLSNVGKANRLIGQRRGLPGAAPSAPGSVEAREPHGASHFYRPKMSRTPAEKRLTESALCSSRALLQRHHRLYLYAHCG
ncbi:hypothetical protein MC48_023495 [Serratia marcescens]|nr:hypothetical protein MC48_023495 [Serratia marcescens]